MKKSGDRQTHRHTHTDDTHSGKNYSRRRNLFRRRQKNTRFVSHNQSSQNDEAPPHLGVLTLAEPLEDRVLRQDFRIVKEEDDLLKDSLEDHVLVAVLLYFVDEGEL